LLNDNNKGLYPSPDMSLTVGLGGEGKVTHSALERTFPIMGPKMADEG